MTLIETHPGESDADLRAVVDGILQTWYPETPNWWHPYKLGATRRHDGKLYREFDCDEGRVEIWLGKAASEYKTRDVLRLSVTPDGEFLPSLWSACSRAAFLLCLHRRCLEGQFGGRQNRQLRVW